MCSSGSSSSPTWACSRCKNEVSDPGVGPRQRAHMVVPTITSSYWTACSRSLKRKAKTNPAPPRRTVLRGGLTRADVEALQETLRRRVLRCGSRARACSRSMRPTRCSPGSIPAASHSTPRFASPRTTGPPEFEFELDAGPGSEMDQTPGFDPPGPETIPELAMDQTHSW